MNAYASATGSVIKPRTRPSWEHYGLQLARVAAGRSEDPYIQVGAVVLRADNSVAGIGYNGAPSGVEVEWGDRERRRSLVVHAEVNALRWVTPDLSGAWMVVTHHPCAACMAAAAAHNVRHIVYAEMPDPVTYNAVELRRVAAELGLSMRRAT